MKTVGRMLLVAALFAATSCVVATYPDDYYYGYPRGYYYYYGHPYGYYYYGHPYHYHYYYPYRYYR